LTATPINNVAAAFIVAGFVAPVVNGRFTSAAVLWIIIGVALHAAEPHFHNGYLADHRRACRRRRRVVAEPSHALRR
jgi:hypothetical protein